MRSLAFTQINFQLNKETNAIKTFVPILTFVAPYLLNNKVMIIPIALTTWRMVTIKSLLSQCLGSDTSVINQSVVGTGMHPGRISGGMVSWWYAATLSRCFYHGKSVQCFFTSDVWIMSLGHESKTTEFFSIIAARSLIFQLWFPSHPPSLI